MFWERNSGQFTARIVIARLITHGFREKNEIPRTAQRDLEAIILIADDQRSSRNPNLHVAITHAWHVFSQHLFGLENEWNAQNAI